MRSRIVVSTSTGNGGENMTVEEKLQLIEQVLQLESNTLMISSSLEDIAQWDSLNILNLQIELTAIKPDISFDNLYECKTVGDICDLITTGT